MAAPLLDIRGLETRVFAEEGGFLAVDRVSFSLQRGDAVGLVGESGCGKTLLALSLMRLLPPNARIERGQVALEGVDLLTLGESAMRAVRGSRMAMIFQEPLTALNPVLSIGDQVAEVARVHRGVDRREARRLAVEALREVRFGAPETRVDSFPHQLSGGMRQRALIAMALAGDPPLLIADEPTTALDATVEAQILALLRRLREERGLAVLLISHDLATVTELCDRVIVMHAGEVVESGPARAVFERPAHPYTEALLASRPSGELRDPRGRRERLKVVPGRPPGPFAPEPGCRYAVRCGRRQPRCAGEAPVLGACGPEREVRCFFPISGAGDTD